jgi:hypothetical protein
MIELTECKVNVNVSRMRASGEPNAGIRNEPSSADIQISKRRLLFSCTLILIGSYQSKMIESCLTVVLFIIWIQRWTTESCHKEPLLDWILSDGEKKGEEQRTYYHRILTLSYCYERQMHSNLCREHFFFLFLFHLR